MHHYIVAAIASASPFVALLPPGGSGPQAMLEGLIRAVGYLAMLSLQQG